MFYIYIYTLENLCMDELIMTLYILRINIRHVRNINIVIIYHDYYSHDEITKVTNNPLIFAILFFTSIHYFCYRLTWCRLSSNPCPT